MYTALLFLQQSPWLLFEISWAALKVLHSSIHSKASGMSSTLYADVRNLLTSAATTMASSTRAQVEASSTPAHNNTYDTVVVQPSPTADWLLSFVASLLAVKLGKVWWGGDQ
jgi:transcription elongation factor